jgi:hypothetical protein
MHRLTVCMSGLLALLAVQSHAAEPELKRRTIAMTSGGKTSEIMVPLGVPADLAWNARKTDFLPDGSVHLSGKVQLTLALDKGAPLSLFADDVTVRSETLDAGQAEAVRDLQQMGVSDQSLRGNPAAMTKGDVRKQEEIDRANMQRLAAIIQAYGWPGNRFAGVTLASNAFLVLQHADRASQHQYLPVLRRAVEQGNASAQDLAMLEDRVLVGDGKPQLYGTQFKPVMPDQPMEMYPVQDEAHLDQRRSALGLVPMAEYTAYIHSVYQKK